MTDMTDRKNMTDRTYMTDVTDRTERTDRTEKTDSNHEQQTATDRTGKNRTYKASCERQKR